MTGNHDKKPTMNYYKCSFECECIPGTTTTTTTTSSTTTSTTSKPSTTFTTFKHHC